MANEEHLRILAQGVANWNVWVEKSLRRANLHRANLSGANLYRASLRGAGLHGADLSGADLSAGNLSAANLSGANLSRANVSEANLSGADLTGADLSEANLGEANLSGARLSEANLSGADLSRANLSGAYLTKTNFENAKINETLIVDVDLSSSNGLEICNPSGPSTIDHRTLARSGVLPVKFLRGCGLAPWQIEEAKLLNRNLPPSQIADIQAKVFMLRTRGPLLMHNLFISYSHADTVFVDALEQKLIAEGILFWRDIHDAVGGRLDKNIERGMRHNPIVLTVLSENSVTSAWVEHEVNLATKLRRELKRDTLYPITLDEAWTTCDWSAQLRSQIEKYYVLSFANWTDGAAFETTFRKLLKGLSLFYKPPSEGR